MLLGSKDISRGSGEGCKVPKLVLHEPELDSLYEEPEPLKCDKAEPNWMAVDGLSLSFRSERFRLNKFIIDTVGLIERSKSRSPK